MDQITAEQLSKKLHIAMDAIVREEYEMIFLQGLLASELSDSLIFKGGTALRLVYGSPRFSEDLDFASKAKIKQKDFALTIKQIIEPLAVVDIKDLREKYYTHFALLRVREAYMKQAFSIKIEVSKRPVKWQEGKDFISQTCKSQASPLEVVGFVTTLERSFLDKKKAIKSRNKARDLFDLWWLGKKLGKPTTFKLTQAKLTQVRSELNQFLPEHMRKTVDLWRKT